MIKFAIFLFTAAAAIAELIPARRLVQWEPDVDVGVLGGIDQYQPGGASERTTLIDVTGSPYNADNTGATAANTAISSAIAAATAGQVVYLPAGVYKSTGSITLSKSNITLRGADWFSKSTSSVTIGTGEKTFTVPSGGHWTAGCGIWIWAWEQDEYDYAIQPWLKGTVTSYSGTTLVVNVTETFGSGTFGSWRVGVVVIDHAGGSGTYGIFMGTSSGIYPHFDTADTVATLPLISGSPAKGDYTVTIDRGSFSAPQQYSLCQVMIDTQLDANAGHADDSTVALHKYGYRYTRRHQGYITNVTALGGTLYEVTMQDPLPFDLPAALFPRMTYNTAANLKANIGVEKIVIRGDNSGGSLLTRMVGTYNCWWDKVHIYNSSQFGWTYGASVRTTARWVWVSHRRGSGGAGGGGFAGGFASNSLWIHCIASHNQPAFEINSSTTSSAFLYNRGVRSNGMNTNHGPHNSFNLWEGNVADYTKSDGYFGGESEGTQFRNWYTGTIDPTTSTAIEGGIYLRRLSYNFNLVGNVFGTHGIANGLVNYGSPNIGGGTGTGNASMRNGDPWIHLDENGPTVIGELTTRTSDTVGTITFDSIDPRVHLGPPIVTGPEPFALWWTGVGNNPGLFTVSSATSTTINVTREASGVLPVVGTEITFWPGRAGMTENDDDVGGTVIEKGNYFVSGSSGSTSSTGGDTIPASLAYSSQPSDWPSALAWPPVDPYAPSFPADKAITPASYFYVYGALPAAAPPSATATINTLNVTGSLNIAP
jgi:hypothetical protein